MCANKHQHLQDNDKNNPRVIIILSGKRKSGKDYVGDILASQLSGLIAFRIAGPIKKQYAIDHSLEVDKLLDASEYKEKYRLEMVKWSEDIRRKDPDYFLKLAIQESQASKYPIWMLTDARRLTDVRYFKNNQDFASSCVLALRIKASEETRSTRGWTFTPGIDDQETECGLDDYKDWDFVISNDGDNELMLQQLNSIMKQVKEVMIINSS